MALPLSVSAWLTDAIDWLDQHSGSMAVVVGAVTGAVTIVLAYLTWRVMRSTQDAVNLERESAQRASEPMLRAELHSEADESVLMRIRNIGLGPAVDVLLVIRSGHGAGSPITGARLASLLPGESEEISMERFPPAGEEAEAEFDLVYSDARQSVVKHQLWHFELAHDVVTGNEYVRLSFTVKWPEDIAARKGLLGRGGKVRVDGDDTAFEPETLPDAWLLKFGSNHSGSTQYVRALRALEERRARLPKEG